MPRSEEGNPIRFTRKFAEMYANRIEDAVRTLLEEKHLYQSTRVEEPDAVWEALVKSNALDLVVLRGINFASLAEANWISESTTRYGFPPVADGPPDLNSIRAVFTPPTIKVYCTRCERVEPHNFERTESCGDSSDEDARPFVQTFAFSYLCQSCKDAPTIFLVRRRGTKLTLCGRAPMEEPEVANHIPKEVRKYFGSALVAAKCGQTIAAIALLRVCVEQFVRGATDMREERDVDRIFDAYQKGLDEFVRDRCPSLRVVYDNLSEALHRALEDGGRFQTAADDVDRHFVGRATVGRMGTQPARVRD